MGTSLLFSPVFIHDLHIRAVFVAYSATDTAITYDLYLASLGALCFVYVVCDISRNTRYECL